MDNTNKESELRKKSYYDRDGKELSEAQKRIRELS